MEAVLFDLDGVFYQGNQLIAGADAVASWVKQQRIPHLFLTNTTSIPRSDIVEKLQSFGIDATIEQVFTPPVAAIQWLRQNSKKDLHLLVPEATRSEFIKFNCSNESVEAIIVGDLGEQWTYEKLNGAFRHLMNKPAPVLIALGMTRYWQAEDGLRLDVAPFVHALSYAASVEPVVMGKPDKHFYAAALSSLDTSAATCMMIGDDIHGDVGGAQNAGIKAALVKTGKFREEDLESGIKPNYLFETICDLPEFWKGINAGV